MPQRTLRFRIHADGRVEERVEGVKGEACLALTERLEAALGSVVRRESTPEAYSTNAQQIQTVPVEHV
jgi:hypothetical protein